MNEVMSLPYSTICSVSTKLDTFPLESIPREKSRVPGRFALLLDIRMNLNCCEFNSTGVIETTVHKTIQVKYKANFYHPKPIKLKRTYIRE
jgi:hypothetical protein